MNKRVYQLVKLKFTLNRFTDCVWRHWYCVEYKLSGSYPWRNFYAHTFFYSFAFTWHRCIYSMESNGGREDKNLSIDSQYGIVIKRKMWTNDSHQPTNKRWNEIYAFFTAHSSERVCARVLCLFLPVYLWVCVCVCVDVPLDGINNNKAKLRESLITISRFHLTAVLLREPEWPL